MFDDLKLAWELWGYWRQLKGGTMTQDQVLQLVTFLIPLATPLLTRYVKQLVPKIPKVGILILQPVLGALLGALTGDPGTGALLGAGGVYVREAVDQTGKALGLVEKKDTSTIEKK